MQTKFFLLKMQFFSSFMHSLPLFINYLTHLMIHGDNWPEYIYSTNDYFFP